MAKSNPTAIYASCAADEKWIVALLALQGEPLGKTRLLECLRKAGIRDDNQKAYAAESLTAALARLRGKHLITEVQGLGFAYTEELQTPALLAAIEGGVFESLCAAIDAVNPVKKSWNGSFPVRSYPQAIARLRMALLRGQPPELVRPWLETCRQVHYAREEPPLVAACGRPFVPELFARLHPDLQDQAMASLLLQTMREPEKAPPLRAWPSGAWRPSPARTRCRRCSPNIGCYAAGWTRRGH